MHLILNGDFDLPACQIKCQKSYELIENAITIIPSITILIYPQKKHVKLIWSEATHSEIYEKCTKTPKSDAIIRFSHHDSRCIESEVLFGL